ncbi:MAG: O-methyltransferase [Vicinamibacterales bacterium]
MRVLICSALLLTFFFAPTVAQQVGGGAAPPAIDTVLRGIRAADKGQLAVSEEDGRFLRVMVATRQARSILEIGAASGYSGIWLGLGARESGGKVVAIEFDPQRAKEAAANIARTGLTDVVRVVHGDAFAEIPKLTGMFDLVFLDAWKPDYKKFFDLVYPRLAPGGVFMAHNVVNKKSEMEPFLAAIFQHPNLFTSVVSPGSEGMSVSYKRR